jgi:hypothetical protein
MSKQTANCDQCGERAWFACEKCHVRLCGKCFQRAGKLGAKGHFLGKDEVFCPRCGELRTWIDLR